MATYPTLYSSNAFAYQEFMNRNFGAYSSLPLEEGVSKGVFVDPTLLFTNGINGVEVDRLSGSGVNQSGVNRMFQLYGTQETIAESPDSTFGLNRDSEANGPLFSIFNGGGGNGFFPFGKGQGEPHKDPPTWLILILILLLLFGIYTAYRIYLK